MNMEGNRSNPENLLTLINQEEEKNKQGRLKIFFGMSSGVGKTYTMLQTAHRDLSKGIDVVVGYVETHNQSETNALLDGLEVIPRKKREYKNEVYEEMDLHAILHRHPSLVLIDDLAHVNAKGSRHAKRYQSIQELLDNGINVYTTLNLQHIESKNDIIARITGVTVKDIIPDEIFEMADDVKLIDVTPNTLLDRLAEGKVHLAPSQSKEAIRVFSKKENLIALREMSFRLVADRLDKQLKSGIRQKQIEGPWESGSRLLVLIGPSKSSTKLIRQAKNLSYTMGVDFVALHVENTQVLNEEQQEQLTRNIDLARQLGAEVVISSGKDLVSIVLDVVRKENITHVVIGKSGKQTIFSSLFARDNFVNRLLKESSKVDIYVIESDVETKRYKKKLMSYPDFSSSFRKYIFAVLTVLATVGLCLLISNKIGYQSISYILLFVILLLSMFLRLGPVILASAVSVVSWNFFFIPPQYTLKITKLEDILTFCMFFVMALVIGTLTSKVRKQERITRKKEEKTRALFHLTNQLAGAENANKILDIATEDIKRYFDLDVYFLLQDGSGKLKKKLHTLKPDDFTTSEYHIAEWAFEYSKKCGRFADTLPISKFTFYPLKGIKTTPGVIIFKSAKRFDGETELFWETFLTQITNALEYHYFAQLAKDANLLNESDKLYKTLFNSVSHELRIPVAAIMGASDTLLSDSYPDSVRTELYTEILTASNRLNRLIENLLNMSRLETGKIAPHVDWCDINDLFNKVIEDLEEELKPYHIDVVVQPSMPLVRLDFGLMEHILHNLIYNSCKYSKSGTTIRLNSFYENGYLIIREMDRGPGFPVETLPFVFDKFYRAETENTGGLGLGLSIVKGFIEAQNGTISVENRQDGGALFTIKIPTEISYINNLITS